MRAMRPIIGAESTPVIRLPTGISTGVSRDLANVMALMIAAKAHPLRPQMVGQLDARSSRPSQSCAHRVWNTKGRCGSRCVAQCATMGRRR